MVEGPLLAEIVPGIGVELDTLLRAQGRPDLADQIPALRIVAVCSCEVEGCASFYTARPMKRWFRRGKQVPAGDMVVDAIDGEIVFIEQERQPSFPRP